MLYFDLFPVLLSDLLFINVCFQRGSVKLRKCCVLGFYRPHILQDHTWKACVNKDKRLVNAKRRQGYMWKEIKMGIDFLWILIYLILYWNGVINFFLTNSDKLIYKSFLSSKNYSSKKTLPTKYNIYNVKYMKFVILRRSIVN